MLSIFEFQDFEIVQLIDQLYYWQGIKELSCIDSPQGYRSFDECLDEAVIALDEFQNFRCYYGEKP